VKTLRRYHTVTIQAGDQTITAADPLPGDAPQALACAMPPQDTNWHKSGLTRRSVYRACQVRPRSAET
jgi:hypothetical protein